MSEKMTRNAWPIFSKVMGAATPRRLHTLDQISLIDETSFIQGDAACVDTDDGKRTFLILQRDGCVPDGWQSFPTKSGKGQWVVPLPMKPQPRPKRLTSHVTIEMDTNETDHNDAECLARAWRDLTKIRITHAAYAKSFDADAFREKVSLTFTEHGSTIAGLLTAVPENAVLVVDRLDPVANRILDWYDVEKAWDHRGWLIVSASDDVIQAIFALVGAPYQVRAHFRSNDRACAVVMCDGCTAVVEVDEKVNIPNDGGDW